MTSAQAQFKPILTLPPALPNNPATPAKAELGKMLYLDPKFSANRAISCNSCHNRGLAGADTEETSIGHKWQRGGRNAPTVLNAVFNTAQFWDGRAKNLEEQAGGPMVNPVEMASPKQRLAAIPGYLNALKTAFPGCAACHNGIDVGGGMYAPFGVVEKPGADLFRRTDSHEEHR